MDSPGENFQKRNSSVSASGPSDSRPPASTPDDSRSALLLGGHSLQPESFIALHNSNAQRHNLKTEASVIVDGGDSKQLEQEQSPPPPTEDRTHLVAGIGDVFQTSAVEIDSLALEIDEGRKPSEPRSLEETLEKRIRKAHSPSVWSKDDKLFLPINKRDKIISKATIYAELKSLNLGPEVELTEITQQIWGISTFPILDVKTPQKTTRRKLFTILLLMNQVRKILDLIEEGIHDSDLPFPEKMDESEHLYRTLDNGEQKAIAAFDSWESHVWDSFVGYQWRVLAPFWELSSEENPLIRHYPLDGKIILPFIKLPDTEPKASATEYAGGFGESFQHKQTFFAVKKLLQPKSPEAAFEREAASLRRVRGKNHPHIIRLLVTFKHGDDCHLVFPWADENLSNYWKMVHPDGGMNHKNTDVARWMASQFMGLASGIQLIHNGSTNSKGNALSPGEDELFGRHGDLKPENILWFKHDGMGILQIADFGLAAFHRKISCDVPARLAGRSPTHRAPECDAERVSPSSDLWSFGCIILEFVAWYLLGWKEVDEFSTRRLKDERILQYEEDKFFIDTTPTTSIPRGELTVTLKASVTEEIGKLYRLDKCSDFFCDVLDLVESDLLQVQRAQRKTSDQIFRKLEELHQKCLDQPAYCSSKTKTRADLDLKENGTTPGSRTDNGASTLTLTADAPSMTQNTEREPSLEDYSGPVSHHNNSRCGENEQNQRAIDEVSQGPDAVSGTGSPATEATLGGTKHSKSSDPGKSRSRPSFWSSLRRLGSRIFNLVAKYLCVLPATSEIRT